MMIFDFLYFCLGLQVSEVEKIMLPVMHGEFRQENGKFLVVNSKSANWDGVSHEMVLVSETVFVANDWYFFWTGSGYYIIRHDPCATHEAWHSGGAARRTMEGHFEQEDQVVFTVSKETVNWAGVDHPRRDISSSVFYASRVNGEEKSWYFIWIPGVQRYKLIKFVSGPHYAWRSELRFSSFNIAVGGRQIVDGESIIDAIIASNADVIGLQEVRIQDSNTDPQSGQKNIERFRQQLEERQGCPWFADYPGYSNCAILSRLCFCKKLVDDIPCFEFDRDGQKVVFIVCHLRGYPYGPYDLRDGTSVEKVLENENHHVDEMSSITKVLRNNYIEKGWTAVLAGDFNAPSHLDWTEATRKRNFNLVVPWPLSLHLEENEFYDTFREVRPDPWMDPGYTWTDGWPPCTREHENEKFDRIDYVLVGGIGLKFIESKVFGGKSRCPEPDKLEVGHWALITDS